MTDWGLIGGDPAPGSVAAAQGLAESLRTVARKAVGVQQRLRSLADFGLSSTWEGLSADAFAAQMDELPAMSDKVFQSFSTAGQAMLTYAVDLERLQVRARACLERARLAEADLHSAQAARQSAIVRFNRQADIEGLNSVERWIGRREVAQDYDGTLERAENDLDAERREAEFIREDHERAIDAAVRGIEAAREQGVRNAIRFSIFGVAPFGKDFTIRDMGVVFNESFDRMKPAIFAVSAITLVVVTAGAGTPLIAAAGMGLTGASVANTSTKMLRKGSGEALDESWSDLGIDLGFDLVALGASKQAASRGKDLAVQRMQADVSAEVARRHEISALRHARLTPSQAVLSRYSSSTGLQRMASSRALQHDILIRDLPRLEQLQRSASNFERLWELDSLTKDYGELVSDGRVRPAPALTTFTGPLRVTTAAP